MYILAIKSLIKYKLKIVLNHLLEEKQGNFDISL